jgi:hypothetical protein
VNDHDGSTRHSAPVASLSLDADNLWAYQMTHGDPGWEQYPTYLDELVAQVLPGLAARDLSITFFVVGKDASLSRNRDAIGAMSAAGHEIGNHSFRHQPWLHRYTVGELHTELERAEDALGEVTGERTVGFRGPGYSLSPDVLRVLVDRGYEYDCSTLPTVIGPLARWYYFRSAKLDAAQREERAHLFGSARNGLRPLHPYEWEVGTDRLLEIPVTTMPYLRVPFHLSYVLYLASVSDGVAVRYFENALRVCRLAGVEPSILLHPLDFLGADDVDSLRFFPGMTMEGSHKREVIWRCIDALCDRHRVVGMREHAAAIRSGGRALDTKPASETVVGERVAA